jgi:SSS family solute:Na+ symporter
VILLYGFFINLNNFGMDQNYIQRYHTAKSTKEAAKVGMVVRVFVRAGIVPVFHHRLVPVCLLQPASGYCDATLKHQVAVERLPVTASAC